jgi:hypothetical protein
MATSDNVLGSKHDQVVGKTIDRVLAGRRSTLDNVFFIRCYADMQYAVTFSEKSSVLPIPREAEVSPVHSLLCHVHCFRVARHAGVTAIDSHRARAPHRAS